MSLVKNPVVRKLLGLDPLQPPLRERFSVGRCTYGEPFIPDFGDKATLRVGAFCSFAGNVTIILGGNHRVDWITTFPFMLHWDCARDVKGHPATKGDVVIGNDVWIGYRAMILSGVRVGNGAVIGAEAVVAKDVPPYGIVVGNPARLVRKRFSDEQIATLERIAWWDWSDAKIEKAMPLLLSGDIAGLAKFAEANESKLM